MSDRNVPRLSVAIVTAVGNSPVSGLPFPLHQRAGAQTDVVAGIEAGLHTVLVMTGISDPAEIERYPFRPDEVLTSVAELIAPEPIESEMPEGI